jgi:gas vesicle protein GvpN
VTTVLRASPRRFVSTPAIERIAMRALRYLQSGFSVHLRGSAGVGKTTLALHLADLLTRPIMLMYGDDDSKSSDLIGAQSGYTRKKVVDNFIHSVVKVEDELKHTWVDSRLTLACREGFTLVYDEFNRSRPEVNNVLLSALEEKLLVLPPTSNQTEYIRVNPNFRAILTSNPEEYCGVHGTQDALMDRLVTIDMPEPDELTQQEILVQKTDIDRASALFIVRLVRAFREKSGVEKASGLRSCLVIAKICQEHNILAQSHDADFRDLCSDVLLSRAGLPVEEATKLLWELLKDFAVSQMEVPTVKETVPVQVPEEIVELPEEELIEPVAELPVESSISVIEAPELPIAEQVAELLSGLPVAEEPDPWTEAVSTEQKIYDYLMRSNGAGLSDIESEFNLSRADVLEAIRALTRQGCVIHRDRRFFAVELTEDDA